MQRIPPSVSRFILDPDGFTHTTPNPQDGRRPVYLVALLLCAISSLGVASSQTIPQLFITRVLQSLGASPGIAVGAGVVGDIYRLEERGTAMGVFFGAILLGPALAPLVGGNLHILWAVQN